LKEPYYTYFLSFPLNYIFNLQVANSIGNTFGNNNIWKALDTFVVNTLTNADLGSLSFCIHLREGPFQHGHSDGQALSNKQKFEIPISFSQIQSFFSFAIFNTFSCFELWSQLEHLLVFHIQLVIHFCQNKDLRSPVLSMGRSFLKS